MLYIEMRNGDQNVWHTGNTRPQEMDSMENPQDVIAIQADGHELELIAALFGNSIPIPRGKDVVSWYGDIARAILFNL